MKHFRALLILPALCLLTPGPIMLAQKTELEGANLPAQKIGADDLLAIAVYDSPELTRTVRVSSQGQIHLPMLKKAIPAAGMQPVELETAVAQALRSEQILVDPVVTVTVAEYRSRPVSVAGAVKRPLTFQAFGNVTLLDAIARAEGLSPEAGAEILLTHATGSGQTVTQHIPVKDLLENTDKQINPHLVGGEEIRVPEAGRIFVVGSVKHPGAFSMKEASDTSVLKALALAEGLIPFSSKQAFVYRHPPGAAAKVEILIPLDQIIQRKSPDVALAAGDILYVPDAKGRRLSVSAIEKIAAFGVATASGLLIWRR